MHTSKARTAFPVTPLDRVDGGRIEDDNQALITGSHLSASASMAATAPRWLPRSPRQQCRAILWFALTLHAAAHGIADPTVARGALRRVRWYLFF